MKSIGVDRAAPGVVKMKLLISYRRLCVILFATVAWLAAASVASACPFCAAESRTLTEEVRMADAAVLAKLAGPDAADLDSGNAKFKIVRVLAGEDVLGTAKEFDAVFFGEPDTEQIFLVSGIGTDYTEWSTPLPLSEAGVEYLGRLADVPESGADRLAFFQEYLENDEPLLAQDAYEEFARAAYKDVQDLKDRMHHDRLVAWIKDPEVNPTRRRLYLTMLGVCGTAADLPMLEEMIVSGYEDKKPLIEPAVAAGLAMGGPLELPTWTEIIKLDERRKKLGLDALIGCYMVLRGPDGLNLIDARLLKAPKVEYSYVYSAIMALRFLAEETQIVPRDRLLASVRLLLDNPDFADQVIPDLARWEDWSVLERLVAMFKASDSKGYIRPPVVAYLLAATEQPGDVGARATAALADLEKLDPEVVKRARSMMAFGFLARARTVDEAPGAARPETTAAVETSEENQTAAAAQGFSATAADAAAEKDASAETPPDPTEFDKARATNRTIDSGKGSTAATVESDVSSRPVDEAKPPVDESPAVASVAEATPMAASAQTSSPTTEAASPVNTVLVVGLPLGAVVLLAGIY
jgi:hypothetical protein